MEIHSIARVLKGIADLSGVISDPSSILKSGATNYAASAAVLHSRETHNEGITDTYAHLSIPQALQQTADLV